MVMLASQVDGILVSISKETRSYEHLKIFQRKGIPMVLFNRICDELIVPIAHLVGPDSLITSRKRLKGYLDALKKHKIPIDESLIIPYDFTLEKVKIYIRHLMELKYPPDGLFIANDPAAIEAIRTIKNMGIQIPQQIGIVGFSNDYCSNLIEPGLTTVDQPKRLIGSTAMQLLLDLIDKEVSQWKAVTKTLDSKLIVRNSSMLQESEPT
jgi:DNA-binding LacI/PurR family transcriptional regulator